MSSLKLRAENLPRVKVDCEKTGEFVAELWLGGVKMGEILIQPTSINWNPNNGDLKAVFAQQQIR